MNGSQIHMLPSAFSLLISLLLYLYLNENRDCFRDCGEKNIWANLKIQLLDTIFWTQLSKDPDRYTERFRTKTNLLEYDFVVMPMFKA